MKKTNLLLIAIIALISSFGVVAQEIIPVDSVFALSKEQKKTKKYAEKLLKKQENKILLPIEFNSLIGDSVTKIPYELGLNWENAYFVESDNKCANLCIPLKSDKEDIQPLLNVFRDENGTYYRIVITYKQTQTDSVKEEIIMRSNIKGLLINACVLRNKEVVSQLNVVGNTGIIEGKSKNKRSTITYDRFTSVNPSYQRSYADSYEFLYFNSKPYISGSDVKSPY